MGVWQMWLRSRRGRRFVLHLRGCRWIRESFYGGLRGEVFVRTPLWCSGERWTLLRSDDFDLEIVFLSLSR